MVFDSDQALSGGHKVYSPTCLNGGEGFPSQSLYLEACVQEVRRQAHELWVRQLTYFVGVKVTPAEEVELKHPL